MKIALSFVLSEFRLLRIVPFQVCVLLLMAGVSLVAALKCHPGDPVITNLALVAQANCLLVGALTMTELSKRARARFFWEDERGVTVGSGFLRMLTHATVWLTLVVPSFLLTAFRGGFRTDQWPFLGLAFVGSAFSLAALACIVSIVYWRFSFAGAGGSAPVVIVLLFQALFLFLVIGVLPLFVNTHVEMATAATSWGFAAIGAAAFLRIAKATSRSRHG